MTTIRTGIDRFDRETVIAQLRAALEPRPEVLEAYLFGSIARGQQHRTATSTWRSTSTRSAVGKKSPTATALG